MVYFVGAGPGDPDLITVKGQRLIEQADTIIYAGSLVNPDILQGRSFRAKVFDSSKMSLPEIIAAMKRAEPGITVRLHTGDPSLYGAIREQMEELDKLNISYRVVPGVSSFSAAAAALKQEYTVPDGNQTLIITREEGRTPVPEEQSLPVLAGHGAAMALFLSAGMTEKVQNHLLEGGYAEDTPAAIVYRASWPDEKVVTCTVGTLAQSASKNGIQKQALLLVGDFLSAEGRQSKLYDPAFSTDVRAGEKSGIAIACFTDRGEALAQRLAPQLSAIFTVASKAADSEDQSSSVSGAGPESPAEEEGVAVTRIGKGTASIKEWTKENWYTKKALIFIGAAGIAVRAIAPYVKKKTIDPAVLVLDADGDYVIPILSGHIGGGVKLARIIVRLIGSEPVITTASDREGVFAVDTWAAGQGLSIKNPECIADVTSALLAGKRVSFRADVPVEGQPPEGICLTGRNESGERAKTANELKTAGISSADGCEECNPAAAAGGSDLEAGSAEILLTPYERDAGHALLLISPVAVGIGMKRGTGAGRIEKSLQLFLQDQHICPEAVRNLYTIDLKKDEAGLLFFAREAGLSLTFYSADELKHTTGDFTSSSFVKDVTGVDNVCERAAVLGAGTGSQLIVKKSVYEGITFAAAVPRISFSGQN